MTGWHIHIDGNALTMSRPGRARLDVSVKTVFSGSIARPRRLARNIRQDVWRALRTARGFSPVVSVQICTEGVRVLAGGQIDGPVPSDMRERLNAVLQDPANRRRWMAGAR